MTTNLQPICVAVVFVLNLMSVASGIDESSDKAREMVRNYLRTLKTADFGTLKDIRSDALQSTFKDHHFFSLRFRRYPSEIVPEAPLAANNILVVNSGKVTHITNESQLQEHFLKHFPSQPDAEALRLGLQAWLSLAEELHQDGFYKFEEPEISIASPRSTAVVKVTPNTGKGQLSTAFQVKNGKLLKIEYAGSLEPGRRLR